MKLSLRLFTCACLLVWSLLLCRAAEPTQNAVPENTKSVTVEVSVDTADKTTPAPAVEAPPPTTGPEASTTAPSNSELRRLDGTAKSEQVEATKDSSAQKPSDTPAPAPKKSKQKKVRVTANSDIDLSVGSTALVAAGETKNEAVSIMGSTRVDGIVLHDAVAVMGNNVINGKVGQNAVAVLGNLTINGEVEGDAVAVLGNLHLGPNAKVRGQKVSVLGGIIRSDGSRSSQGLTIKGLGFSDDGGLPSWFQNCLLKGRLLCFDGSSRFFWVLALAHLAFYVLIALIFPRAIARCQTTLTESPGMSLLTAILCFVLVPLLLLILAITVVGAFLIPFLFFVLFIISLFGRASVLAWLGSLVTRNFPQGPLSHISVSVLIGGLIALLLYATPWVGFLAHQTISGLGFGAALYAILSSRKNGKQTPPPLRTAGFPQGTSGSARSQSFSTQAAPSVSTPSSQSSSFVGTEPSAQDQLPALPPLPEATLPTPLEAAPTFAPDASVPPVANLASSAYAAASSAANNGPVPASIATLPRATFWQRTLALGIDAAVVGIGITMINSILPNILQLRFGPENMVGTMVMMAIYGALFWKYKGTTIGGTICKLQVVRTDDRPMDWNTSIVRALGCILSFFPLGLGFFWILFDANGESWHDKISGTSIVRLPRSKPLI